MENSITETSQDQGFQEKFELRKEFEMLIACVLNKIHALSFSSYHVVRVQYPIFLIFIASYEI